MKLAETILVEIAGEEIELRPSLRHAMRLERREGSFRQLFREINEGSLTAAVDIIEPHFFGQYLKNRVLDALPTLTPALTAYLLACAGIDPEAPANDTAGAKSGKTQTFSEYLQQLYRYGTGWLDWTPETTLDATPAEILEAYKGKLEMLKAIYGTSEKAKPVDDRPLDDKFRSLFAGIGTQKVESAA
ncbi:hypothetical protein [Pararhizobium qamdonense]|uniref:hypothetical protein n=1 Tax=Pararhizobium qamdonense TaxID=3031126 RepID=UPI0023E32B82|nr:hypothetical protein [Pararhizobium qamdonense]